jgi:hypothetical protein
MRRMGIGVQQYTLQDELVLHDTVMTFKAKLHMLKQ